MLVKERTPTCDFGDDFTICGIHRKYIYARSFGGIYDLDPFCHDDALLYSDSMGGVRCLGFC
jgi:hypothetical protein